MILIAFIIIIGHGSSFTLPSTWRQKRRQQLQISKFPSIHHYSSSTRRCDRNQHRLLKSSALFHLHLSANVMSNNNYNESGDNNRRGKPARIKSVLLNSSSSAQKESTHNTVNIYQMDGPALHNLIKRQQKQRIIDNDKDNDSLSSTSSSCMIRHYEEMLTASISDHAENNSGGYYEPEVYFVATSSLNHTNISIIEEEDVMKNEVLLMGIIGIQLRYKSPLIAGPSSSSTATATSSSSQSTLSSSNDNKREDNLPAAVTLPSPHYYILNLQVETEFRQCGVGMSLLTAIHEYTSCQFDRKSKRNDEVKETASTRCSNNEDDIMNRLKERQRNRRRKRKSSLSRFDENEKDKLQTIPIVLSVDTDNIAAIRLYEKFGFEYLEQNDVFCMMKFDG